MSVRGCVARLVSTSLIEEREILRRAAAFFAKDGEYRR
jgi:hypothetical protein